MALTRRMGGGVGTLARRTGGGGGVGANEAHEGRGGEFGTNQAHGGGWLARTKRTGGVGANEAHGGGGEFGANKARGGGGLALTRHALSPICASYSEAHSFSQTLVPHDMVLSFWHYFPPTGRYSLKKSQGYSKSFTLCATSLCSTIPNFLQLEAPSFSGAILFLEYACNACNACLQCNAANVCLLSASPCLRFAQAFSGLHRPKWHEPY